MPANKKISYTWYIVCDFVAASLVWVLFYNIRTSLLKENFSPAENMLANPPFFIGLVIIPVCWVILYFLAGSYHSLYKKSRLKELTTTFIISLTGCTII